MIRLLLVEDDAAHIELIRRAFDDSTLPAELIIAHSITQAKTILNSISLTPPDLMITDWRLPDGQGIELLNHLGDPPCCPAVVMTSHGNEQVAVDAIKAGALDYVVKSVETFADMPHIAERTLREWEHITERQHAEERIQHLNAVLDAIRSVNKLITRERNLENLVQGVCHNLVQTRGYQYAWLVLVDENGYSPIGNTIIGAQAGPQKQPASTAKPPAQTYDPPLPLPNWIRRTLAAPQAKTIVVHPNHHKGHHSFFVKHSSEEMLVRQLRYKNAVYGILAVSIPDNLATDQEEQELFQDVAEDIAFALYSIEQEQARKRFESQFLQAQKVETIGRLAGGIAHDFNNHLTAITGYSELLLTQFDRHDPKRRDIEEILKAAEHSSALTRQLLIFSRKQVPQPKQIDLNTVVSDMKRMLRRLVGENIEMHTLLNAQGQIQADLGQIEQVLMNLVVNACEAMPLGGQLTIETKNVQLDAQNMTVFEQPPPAQPETTAPAPDTRPKPYVMLQVRDTGVGMSKTVQSHLFEPFFTTKEEGKGTGLGLATVDDIVKQNGGRVWFSSKLGQGTVFRIYLPRIDTTRSAAGPSGDQFTASNQTILVVQEQDSIRALTQRLLERQGYNVLEASNADNAIILCDHYDAKIDLLITDIVISGSMNGPELAGYLSILRPELDVLYTSSYTDTATARTVLAQGLNFIQKPFTPAALGRQVRQILDRASNP